MVGPRTALVTAAFVLALAVPPICLAISPSQTQSPNAKVCGLLPIAELETLYGAKAGTPLGADARALSTCTVTIAGQAVKVAPARPGTAGLPATVHAGLTASSKSGMTYESTLTSNNAGLVTDDHVKALLAKAAARRSS